MTYVTQCWWLVEQFQDATGKYLSGQCEWNLALGLKDIVNKLTLHLLILH